MALLFDLKSADYNMKIYKLNLSSNIEC